MQITLLQVNFFTGISCWVDVLCIEAFGNSGSLFYIGYICGKWEFDFLYLAGGFRKVEEWLIERIFFGE